MLGRRIIAVLSRRWIPTISDIMPKHRPKLLDPEAFHAFLDGYATALDVDPVIRKPRIQRSPEIIWDDFMRIARDADRAIEKNKPR